MPTRNGNHESRELDPKAVEIGKRILTLRERRGWNKSDLARRLDVRPSTVSRIEAGELNPGADTREKLADIFGVTLDAIVRGPLPTVEATASLTPQKQGNVEHMSVASLDFPEPLKRYLEKHGDDLSKREQQLLADFGALHDPSEIRDEAFYDDLVEAHREALRRSRQRGGGS